MHCRRWFHITLSAAVSLIALTCTWAEVKVSRPYGFGSSVSTQNITVKGTGVGDGTLNDTEAFQRAAEVAAAVVAVRNMGEVITSLRRDLQKQTDNGEITDVILKEYVGLEKVLRSTSATLTFRPSEAGSSSIGSSIVRIASAELLSATVVREMVTMNDTIHFYIGDRLIRVENLVTRDADSLPALLALLKENGIQWTFVHQKDGAVTCTLKYPVVELKKRLPGSGER